MFLGVLGNTYQKHHNKQIKQIQDYGYNTMAKTKYIVVHNQIASKNMINEYKRKFLLKRKIKNL